MDPEDAHPLESRPPTRDDLLLICRSLNGHGAQYLVLGGFAIIAQGFTRATEDIDLLIEGSSANLEKVRAALYCQDRGIDDTEQPLTPALSPSEGEREKPRQFWV